jgi:hypothetical protein
VRASDSCLAHPPWQGTRGSQTRSQSRLAGVGGLALLADETTECLQSVARSAALPLGRPTVTVPARREIVGLSISAPLRKHVESGQQS